MSKCTPLSLIRLALAASCAAVIACSGGDKSGGAEPAPVLSGDFVRTLDSTGELQEISFVDSSRYEAVPTGCDVANGCATSGTYTFDDSVLTLTDGATGTVKTFHISAVTAETTAEGTGLVSSLHPEDGPLVTPQDAGLVSPSFKQQLINGICQTPLLNATVSSATCTKNFIMDQSQWDRSFPSGGLRG